jgi:acyl-CoA synthetase (AMP-forming)/AMP-acid ligase II
MNIVDLILFQCRFSPPAAAICAPATEFNLVSYARLERFIHNVSRKALGLGLSRGQTVAIFVADPILHAAIILGLMRLGIITASGQNPQLPGELSVSAVIADTGFPYRAPKIIRADHDWVSGDGRPIDEEHLLRTNPNDVCRIVLTSGTTGDAKAVALTHRMLAERIARHLTVFGNVLPQCSRTYCDLGLATSLGFQFLIYMLWRGGTVFYSGSAIDPLIRAFVDFEVENMIAAPAGLANFLRYYEEERSARHKLRMIMSGGSLLSSSLAEKVRSRMCSNVLSSYGSTEASVIASAPAHALANVPGAVGYLLPEISLEIVDEFGNPLPAGAEGTVRVRSPYNVTGYVGDPLESRSAFRDGWFYPGDVARLTRHGLLVISGRQKTIVNLGGEKVKPELVEEVITSFDGVERAGVFGVTNDLGVEELWSLVVPRAAWNEAGLRSHCEGRLPSSLIPVRFIVVDALPLNPMGKVERHRLLELAKVRRN